MVVRRESAEAIRNADEACEWLVREFEYFNDRAKAAAAAKLWAESYIDCVERGEMHPW